MLAHGLLSCASFVMRLSVESKKPRREVRYASGVTPTDYTYTGQYSYASDFGLMYYHARWYDPSLGRFAQADTIVPGGVQGYDRYAYTNNNPVRYTDPSGHAVKGDTDEAGARLRGCAVSWICMPGMIWLIQMVSLIRCATIIVGIKTITRRLIPSSAWKSNH